MIVLFVNVYWVSIVYVYNLSVSIEQNPFFQQK